MNRIIVKKATKDDRDVTYRITSSLRDIVVKDDKYRVPLFRESARFMTSREVCPMFYLLQGIPMADFMYMTPLMQKLTMASPETTERCLRLLNQRTNFDKPPKADIDQILDGCYTYPGSPFMPVFSNQKWEDEKKRKRG